MQVQKFQEFKKKVNDNVSKVIVGKERYIDKIIVSFICSGHVLLEDVPGLGKTKLARAFAKSIGCEFRRIQFTPDLLPSDLTGMNVFNQKTGEFEFRKGPLLGNIILADEINRATPRTQSALLEAMGEGQITVEGVTTILSKPFFVLATQNPVEQFGTFPLPEAQLDRFFMRMSLGYPNEEQELIMLNRFQSEEPLDNLQEVVTKEDIEYVQKNYQYVEIKDDIKQYIVDIIKMTRCHEKIRLGSSPRGTLSLMKGSQANAAINGRDYVIAEDIKYIAKSILCHRMLYNGYSDMNHNIGEDIMDDILKKVNTPMEKI